MMLIPIAAFGPEMAGLIVPVVIFMIPIIAILTSHQRKMAELMRPSGQPVDARVVYEIEALRREVTELKTLLHQQAIAIDNIAPRLAPPTDVASRFENIGT